MTEVEKRLRAYIKSFESAGETNPTGFMDGLDPGDRAELSALIDGYLEHAAPSQAWNKQAFKGSVSEQAMKRVAEHWSMESSELSLQLVELRNERKLLRRQVVEGLSKWLNLTDAQEKVGRYYHQLERGALPARQVSSRVWEGLGSVLGTSAESLRKAGESVTPSAGGEPDALWARLAPGAPADKELRLESRIPEDHPDETTEEDWDEVDRLFRGGG